MKDFLIEQDIKKIDGVVSQVAAGTAEGATSLGHLLTAKAQLISVLIALEQMDKYNEFLKSEIDEEDKKDE